MSSAKFQLSDLNTANSEEVECVAIHYRACWKETYSDRFPSSAVAALLSQANANEIRSWATGDGARKITVVRSNNQIIGSVACNCIQGRCYIWGMYVPKLFQNNGVGGLLLESCLKRAEINMCSALELLVLESSPKAVKFYLGNGFKKLEKTAYEVVAEIELASWRMERRVG